jgi:hypothetical protein
MLLCAASPCRPRRGEVAQDLLDLSPLDRITRTPPLRLLLGKGREEFEENVNPVQTTGFFGAKRGSAWMNSTGETLCAVGEVYGGQVRTLRRPFLP